MCEFDVLDDVDMRYDAILGLKFLKQNFVELDMPNRTIIFRYKGGTRAIISYDGDRIKSANYMNIPVYSSENKVVKGYESCLVSFYVSDLMLKNNDFYFEGNDNQNLNYCHGIVSRNDQRVICENLTHKKKFIRKGEKIGVISSLLEINLSLIHI